MTEADYPQITIKTDPIAGLTVWLEKILDCSKTDLSKGPWNVVIADLWPNDGMSRLIGHVQMDDVSVGYDTGYRVCSYVSDARMEYYEGDDLPLFKSWLEEAVKTPALQDKLHAVAEANSFEIRLTHYGENPIRDAIRIPY